MESIVLLDTAWGRRFGGINAFNRDFAGGLAQELGRDGTVYCAVLKGDEADEADAKLLRVKLIWFEEKDGDAAFFDPRFVADVRDMLRTKHGVPAVDYWIGHDVISGAAAVRASQKGGRAALIMHMSFREYGALKYPGDPKAL